MHNPVAFWITESQQSIKVIHMVDSSWESIPWSHSVQFTMKAFLILGMLLRARMKRTHTDVDGKLGVFRGGFSPEIRITHLGTLLWKKVGTFRLKAYFGQSVQSEFLCRQMWNCPEIRQEQRPPDPWLLLHSLSFFFDCPKVFIK